MAVVLRACRLVSTAPGHAARELWRRVLKWPDDQAEDKGLTVWHIAEAGSQWFSPSDSSFMINYRVDNLGDMIAQLRAGIAVIRGPESHENGKVAWIVQPCFICAPAV